MKILSPDVLAKKAVGKEASVLEALQLDAVFNISRQTRQLFFEAEGDMAEEGREMGQEVLSEAISLLGEDPKYFLVRTWPDLAVSMTNAAFAKRGIPAELPEPPPDVDVFGDLLRHSDFRFGEKVRADYFPARRVLSVGCDFLQKKEGLSPQRIREYSRKQIEWLFLYAMKSVAGIAHADPVVQLRQMQVHMPAMNKAAALMWDEWELDSALRALMLNA